MSAGVCEDGPITEFAKFFNIFGIKSRKIRIWVGVFAEELIGFD